MDVEGEMERDLADIIIDWIASTTQLRHISISWVWVRTDR